MKSHLVEMQNKAIITIIIILLLFISIIIIIQSRDKTQSNLYNLLHLEDHFHHMPHNFRTLMPPSKLQREKWQERLFQMLDPLLFSDIFFCISSLVNRHRRIPAVFGIKDSGKMTVHAWNVCENLHTKRNGNDNISIVTLQWQYGGIFKIHIAELNRFFFAELHKHLFNSAMPERPKPDCIAVLVAATFLSWLMLLSKVLTLFKLCKDLEYVSLLYLMEEVISLLLFHYLVIFRSSNLDNYLQTMRFPVSFICWRRHHYNKSTSSFLSDIKNSTVRITTALNTTS